MLRARRKFLLWFTDTTSIRGISFIKVSNNRCEKLFWVILFIIFLSLTVYHLVESCLQFFLYEPVFSIFNLMLNNTVVLREAKICFSFDSSALGTGLNFQDWQQTEVFLSQFPDSLNYTNVLEFDNLPVSVASFMVDPRYQYKVSSEVQQLVMLTTQMLASIVRAEDIFSPTPNPMTSAWGLFDPMRLTFDSSGAKSLELVRDFHLNRSTDFADLISTTCVYLCQLAQLRIFATNYDEEDSFERYLTMWNPCNKANCYYLGLFQLVQYEYLCLRDMSDLWFRFNTSSTDSTLIATNPLLIYGNTSRPIADLIGQVYIGFGAGFGSRTFDIYHQPYLTQKKVYIQIIGDFRAKNLRRNPCIEVNYFECMAICRAEYIRKTCDCYALSAVSEIKKPQGKYYCGEKPTRTGYIWGLSSETCKNLSQLIDPNPTCSQGCYDECDTFDISFTQMETNVPYSLANMTITDVLVKNFFYPYIEERELIDWGSFLARLGGNLSCYLGINVLGLLQIFALVVKCATPQRSTSKKLNSQHAHELRLTYYRDQ